MEYDQSNPNYQKPDYYSYNPEIEQGTQDTFNLDPIIEPPNYGTDIYGNPLTAEDSDPTKPLKKKPPTAKPSADQTVLPSEANSEYRHLVLGKPFELGNKDGEQAAEPAPAAPERDTPRKLVLGKPFELYSWYKGPSSQGSEPDLHPDLAQHVGSAHDTEEREKQRQAAIRKEQERKAALKRSRELKLAAQRAREKTQAREQATQTNPKPQPVEQHHSDRKTVAPQAVPMAKAPANVQPAQQPLQQNSSPAMQQPKPSWKIPSSSAVFETNSILWDNRASANESSPIFWSTNPQPVFRAEQSPVSQNAALTNPVQQPEQKSNGKPPVEAKTPQNAHQPGVEVARKPKGGSDSDVKKLTKTDGKSEKKEDKPWWQTAPDPVVTSSAAGRSQRLVQQDRGLLEQYRLNKGRVELHNHRGGVLPPGKIVDLAYSGADKYKQAFDDLYSNGSQKGADGKQITPLSEDSSKQATVLKKQLQDVGIIDAQGKINPAADAEMYERGVRQLLSAEHGSEFDALYPRRGLIESKIPPKRLAAAILLEVRGQDINYTELQGLRPKGVSQTEWEAMQRIAKVQVGSLEQAKTEGFKGDRKRSAAEIEQHIESLKANTALSEAERKKLINEARTERRQAEENEGKDLLNKRETKALDNVGKDGVVGIDINGPEKHLFGEGGMDKFEEMHEQLKAKSEALRASGDPNAKVVFRVHVGEGYQDQKTGIDHSDTGRKNVETLLTKLEDMKAKGQLSNGVVLRLGHLTHASDDQLQRIATLQTELRSKGIELFTEANLTSNERTGTVKGKQAGDQVLLKQLYHGVTPTINTDGGGVMGTTLPREYDKAQDAIDKFKSNKVPVEVMGANGQPEHKFFRDLDEHQRKNFDMERIHAEGERYRSNVVPHLPLPNVEAHPSRFSGIAESPVGKFANNPTTRSGLLAGGLSTFNHMQDGKLDRDDVGAILGDTALGAGSSHVSDFVSNRFFNNIPPGAMQQQAEKMALNQISGEASESMGKRVLGSVTDSKFRMGAKGGAVVDAITSGVFSTFDNADAYRKGNVTAGQATANVAVDTGVGVASGLTGMAAGAAIGSVIPVAGTVVGGLIGFGAGLIGSWAAHSALDGSGLSGWAKEKLGGVLNNYNQPLGKAWDWTSKETAAISDTTSKAWNATADGVSGAANTVAGGVSDAASTVAGGLGKAWSWVGG